MTAAARQNKNREEEDLRSGDNKNKTPNRSDLLRSRDKRILEMSSSPPLDRQIKGNLDAKSVQPGKHDLLQRHHSPFRNDLIISGAPA